MAAGDEGIGLGIGEGLHTVASAIRQAQTNRETQRDKAAAEYEDLMKGVAANIQQLGGKDAPEAAPYVQQLYQLSAQHNALYPAHETPALIARIGKIFGKQPGPPQQDIRALSPEAIMAATPLTPPGRQQLSLQQEIAQVDQALRTAYPQMPDAERRQKAFQLVAGQKTAAAGRTQLIKITTTPYLNKQDGKYYESFINPEDPTKLIPVEVPGYQPPTKLTGAQAPKVVREPGSQKPLYVQAGGQQYLPAELNDPANADDPLIQHSKALFDQAQETWQATTKEKAQAKAEQHAWAAQQQAIRDKMMLERESTMAGIQIDKSIKLGNVNDVRKLYDASEKASRVASDAYTQGLNAEKITPHNSQADRTFVLALLRSVSPGTATRNPTRQDMELITGAGPLAGRIEDLWNTVFGDQTLQDDIRDNLLQIAYSNAISRGDFSNQDKASLAEAERNALGPGAPKPRSDKTNKFLQLMTPKPTTPGGQP